MELETTGVVVVLLLTDSTFVVVLETFVVVVNFGGGARFLMIPGMRVGRGRGRIESTGDRIPRCLSAKLRMLRMLRTCAMLPLVRHPGLSNLSNPG